ncbi:MAG: DUF2723 domain-containing protein [Candidatus Eremiobacteraeota bacterium]|nr:DUF2723 domain-containing protein [Candidatus Eremiobacteraeota bacterium]
MISEEDREPAIVPSVARVLDARIWAPLAFLLPFALFALALPPGVSFWDTGEMQTIPYILGISHPTGFPTFVFAGWLFSHALPLGTVAWRIGILTAAAMAAAAYFAYRAVVELDGTRLLGFGSALVFACGYVVWTRGSRTEVHALSLAFACAAICLLLRWRTSGDTRMLSLAALSEGLGLATHGVTVLLLPGLILLLFPRVRLVGWPALARAAACFVAPGLLYAYLPLRSAYVYARNIDPTLSLGLPPGRPFWDFGHPATLASLIHYLGGGDDSKVGQGFASMLDLARYRLVIWKFGDDAINEFGIVALVLAGAGLLLLARRQPYLALAFAVTCGLCIPYALLYPEADPERYLLLPFWGLAVLAAIGATRGIAAYLNRSGTAIEGFAALLVLVLGLGLFNANRGVFAQRHNRAGDIYIDTVIALTPSNAVIVANWAFATPLGYAAFVDHRLGDRIVVTAQPADYREYYAGWMKTRPVYVIADQEYPVEGYRQIRLFRYPAIARLEPQ